MTITMGTHALKFRNNQALELGAVKNENNMRHVVDRCRNAFIYIPTNDLKVIYRNVYKAITLSLNLSILRVKDKNRDIVQERNTRA